MPLLALGLHEGFEVLAGHKIHHQEISVFFGEEVGDLWQVRMIQSCQDRGFTAELIAGLLSDRFGERFVVLHLFQGAQAPREAGVLSQVDRSHAASADNFFHEISLAK